VADGACRPNTHHLYEAAVDAILLADAGNESEVQTQHAYSEELRAIVDYILGLQLSNGGWDYPPGAGRDGTAGDTSVIQYALLGLWAAERSGIQITPSVWERSIQWHIANQNKDGGYAYVPGTGHGFGAGASVLNMTINAIGSVYIAMLHLDPERLPELTNPVIGRPASARVEKVPDRFQGALEQVQLDGRAPPTVDKSAPAHIPPETAQMLTRAYGWLVPRFKADNNATGFRAYYYYSLERMSALANVQEIGQARWFDVCADFLMKEQNADGSWKMSSHNDEKADTAFVVLFYTRSTGKLLRRTIPQDPLGGGLLAGGRGLPDDLSKPVSPTGKKDLGPVDQLLAALENPGAINIDDIQQAIVEKVQVGDRKALVGQKDLLVKYIQHPDAEVRRMAAWALGRTDDLSLARYLVGALDDPNLDVMVEARNALCWLSRKPRGLGETDDPFEGLPEDASDEQRKAAVAKWHSDLLRLWGPWYLDHRPYADRGDEFEAGLRERIARN
jgi:hypothetical protein